jgi:hypothetical protein
MTIVEPPRIFDECFALKSSSGVRSSASRHIGDLAPNGNVVSATPCLSLRRPLRAVEERRPSATLSKEFAA